MGTTTTPDSPLTLPPLRGTSPADSLYPPRRPLRLLLLLTLWSAIFAAGLIGPPLLDDADATHAQAAQAILASGDWVTLHVDGVRYLEKAPLPYWIAALFLRLFPGHPAFAIHLPLALTVLALALLAWHWSSRAFGEPAGICAAIFVLTATGTFLFTRIFIPDALLSLLLALALYALLRALEATSPPVWAYTLWLAVALAVLTKGLVALIFLFGTAVPFLLLTRQLRHWRRLRPFTGLVLLLAVAAPWHLLAGLRNTGAANGHGFFWFYFINEHVLRFLGRRIPRDYNKLPVALYWSLHLVWLFPWSLFAPAPLLLLWRNRRRFRTINLHTFAEHTVLLLLLFSALVLVFFSLSTNQEYYTFPVYLPLLILLAGALAPFDHFPNDTAFHRCLSFSFIAFCVLGLLISAALAYGLWCARHLPYIPDIGVLLAHRGVGDYTLSMSHFFDLTGPSFAALRLPATLALLAFSIGPLIALGLHRRRRLQSALIAVTLTSTTFLVAAHIALLRFTPMLSSADFAATVRQLQTQRRIAPDSQVLILGDQANGSSLPFYLHQRVYLVDGRTTSMLFGSTFPDAPPLFLTHQQLLAQWGSGPRKILFVPLELRDQADHLLGLRKFLLAETSGKALFTDRPLDPPTHGLPSLTSHPVKDSSQ